MTAYNAVRLWCDHQDSPAGDAGAVITCMQNLEVAAGDFETARWVAAQKGWTRVAAGGADEGDRCPEHRPAATTPDAEADR